MKKAFQVMVVMLLAFFIADRSAMHAQAGTGGTISCASGAALTRAKAIGAGFPERAADSQAEGFLSSCLISGRGQVGNLVARN
jgi:hypothetical protein